MSISTFFFAALGIFSAFIFFFLMRFKASSKQTNRDNRIKWSKFYSYKKVEHDSIEGSVSSKKDEEFKT